MIPEKKISAVRGLSFPSQIQDHGLGRLYRCLPAAKLFHQVRFETLLGIPIFKKYPDFKEMLDYLASENCRGCRNEQCKLFKTCGVRPCHQEKQIDFCYQCDEFPCNQTNFDERLNKIWVLINEKIKETGLEHYYERTQTRPRYV